MHAGFLAASLRDTRASFSHAAIHWDIVAASKWFYDFSKLSLHGNVLGIINGFPATRNFWTLVWTNRKSYPLVFCITITLHPHHLAQRVSCSSFKNCEFGKALDHCPICIAIVSIFGPSLAKHRE